ncbi:unnamed protein product [Closterium sp. NIES-64]|nr:unnamed protein product [Closterium sp. NIES-64]
MARLVTLHISLVASVALLLLAIAAHPALAGGESASAASIPADSTEMAAASRRVLQAVPTAAPAAAPSAGGAAAPAPLPAVGAPSTAPPSSDAPSFPPASSQLIITSNIKSADVSKSIDLLNYLVYTTCPFLSVKTMFLPSNQAWSDAFEGYKKKRSSGGLYDALDAVVNGDKLKTPKDKSQIVSPTSPISGLSALAADCKSFVTSGTVSKAVRSSLFNLMSFHATDAAVTIADLNGKCNAAGTTFKTVFNGNNLNFKCNSTNSGFISGSNLLPSDASAGTPSAVAKIDDKLVDFFYVNAVVFPSDMASLPAFQYSFLSFLHSSTPLTPPQSQFPPPTLSFHSHYSSPVSPVPPSPSRSHLSSLSLPFLLPLTPISHPSHSRASSLSLPFLLPLTPVPPPPHSRSSSPSLPFLLPLTPVPPPPHSHSSFPSLFSPSLPFLLPLTLISPPSHSHFSSLSPPCILPLTPMYPRSHSHFSSPFRFSTPSLSSSLPTLWMPGAAATISRLLTALLLPPTTSPFHSYPSPHPPFPSQMPGAAATVSRLLTALLVLSAALPPNHFTPSLSHPSPHPPFPSLDARCRCQCLASPHCAAGPRRCSCLRLLDPMGLETHSLYCSKV